MLAWECVDMMYEWTGAAGVSPPHLGVNERVQLGYLPLTYVVYEMVQLGYLPLTLIWCSWGISPSPHCSASQMAEAAGSASMSGRHRSGCLCYVGSGCTYVSLYLYMVYVYVMQCLVCMKLNTWPHEFIHLVHQPHLTNPDHSASLPLPTTFYLKNKLPPPISRYCMFLYTAPHLKNLLCTLGVFMPHVLCTDIPRFVTTNKIPSNLGGRGS